jgi:DNA-binding Lrp family transcriptional regulator
MRPVKSQRSALRYQLDDLLGSPALIRLVRVLVHEVEGPVGVTEAAKMAGLSPPGARKALERLAQAGIAVRVGTGRAQTYSLREGSPYTAALAQLFEQEQRQYDDLIQQLQQALNMPEVTAAWAERLPLDPAEALQITVIADTRAIPWIGTELRQRLSSIEREYDFIIEIAVFTRADAPSPEEEVVFLWGTDTESTDGRGAGAQGYAESAERSLRMSEAIADLIKSDPSLIRRARQHVDRLLHEGQGMANSDMSEWRLLLETYSPERLRDLLVSTSSRAERLRRSLPFFAVLTAEERDRVLKEAEMRR